jgi:hypothetical protein
MLATLRQLLGIRTRAEKLSALPVRMGEEESKRLADLIAGFIDGTCGPYDWDWVMTGPKESQEAERVSSLCASLDALDPPKEKGHFTDGAGLEVLRELVALLRASSASETRVFEFVDEAFKEVEPVGMRRRRAPRPGSC